MALAATLAAHGARPASFLPVVKCSNCGREIAISAMGDHTCSDSAPAPTASNLPTDAFTLRQLNAPGNPAYSLLHNQQAPHGMLRAPVPKPFAPKPFRIAPPKINPDAANKAFLAPPPLRSEPPLSPAISIRSGSSNARKLSSMQNTVTGPAPRLFDPRPPNPENSGNLDCAFPLFPSTPVETRPGTSQSGRKTPSDRAPSRSGSDMPPAPWAEHDRVMYMGPSSLSNGVEKVTQRSKAIRSGPVDGQNRRRASRDENGVPLQAGLMQRRPSLGDLLKRPSTSHAETKKSAPPARPPRPEENVLSRGVPGNFSEERDAVPSIFSTSQRPISTRSPNRSHTFPVEKSPERGRRPSEATPEIRPRRPTLTAIAQTAPSRVPQVEPMPRTQSRNGARIMMDAPPVPNPSIQRTQRQESIHIPTDSGSSMASSSGSSRANSGTSGPSPVGSAASSIDIMSPLTRTREEDMKVSALNLTKAPSRPRDQTQSNLMPPRDPGSLQAPKGRALMPHSLTPPLRQPELPEAQMDPAMQQRPQQPVSFFNSFSQSRSQARPVPSRTNTTPVPSSKRTVPASISAPQPFLQAEAMYDHDDPYRPPSPNSLLISRTRIDLDQRFAPSTSAPWRTPKPTTPTVYHRPRSPQLPSYPPDPTRSQTGSTAVRRATTVNKHSCRGCKMMIEGKSVRAADGRLTGRWHKQCFTCRTCHEQFVTADFYVINDQPYCEQHYHEANGSLCSGCHRGIEGQYLETTSSSTLGNEYRKFHPRCFTCHDCGVVLQDDYFEIVGKVCCETHALAAMRAQARDTGGLEVNNPTVRAERRTTRLMMM